MAYTSPTLVSSGTSFAQFQAGGATAILENLIAANKAGTGNPAVPTSFTATGGGVSGGNLSAGTYYAKVTESNGIGETAGSPEISVTISPGNIPQLTFAALQTGSISRNVYVGIASGAETLYATGITAGTYNLSAAMPITSISAVPVPAVNTTGFSWVDANGHTINTPYRLARAAEKGNLQDVYTFLGGVLRAFNEGDPVSFGATIMELRDAHTAFALLAQLCAEAGTLIDANPGSLHVTTNPLNMARTYRGWP